MKDARQKVKVISLVLFSAFTATKLIQYVAVLSFLPIFLSLSFAIGVVFFIGNKKLLNTGWSFAISAEIVILLDIYLGKLSTVTGITLFITLFVLGMLFLKAEKYAWGASLLNGFTAITISSTLIVLTAGTDFLMLAELLIPVTCSIVYIIWSGRFSYGLPILISNTIIGLTLFYGYTHFIVGDTSITVLTLSFVTILCISLSFNERNITSFKFGYQRFQNENALIKQDIQRLNWSIANEKQCQNKELLQVWNQLKEVPKENPVDELLGRIIHRYDLFAKEQLMRTYTILITASASCLYIASAIYAHSVTMVSPALLIGSYLLYTVIMFYLSKAMMEARLLQFINRHIIMPFNLMVFERQELIHALRIILEDRGLLTGTHRDLEKVYTPRENTRSEQLDLPLFLPDRPIME